MRRSCRIGRTIARRGAALKKERSHSFFNSLRSRVLVFSLLVFGLMTGAVVVNGSRVMLSAMVENIRLSVKQTSEILNIAVAPYATNGNLNTLKVYFDELLNKDDSYGLVYLIIGKEEGPVILQSGLSFAEIPIPDTEESYADAANRGIVHIRQPILLEDSSVGFLQYGMSFKLLLNASDEISRQGLILMVGGLAIASAFILILVLKVIRRINVLVSASRAIAYGDYSHRAPKLGSDEIARLAENFNLMADAVQLRIHEVTQLNQELESRVEMRTHELVALNETLQKTIDDLKWTQDSLVRSEKMASLGSLVAGVAHELNTPVGNALTVASTLHDQTDEIVAEMKVGLKRATLEHYIEGAKMASDLILRNLQRASDLVTGFKHVAVDQTSENRRYFDLQEMVQEVMSTLIPAIKKTPYKFESSVPKAIRMDSYPGPIGQVITNLVNNALIHAFDARDHGHIDLRVTWIDEQHVSMVFHDDGQGISPENLKKIFDPFFTTRLGQGGSGLGMSIVHNLIYTVLGGSITVESELGKGTSFIVNLPLIAPTENKID